MDLVCVYIFLDKISHPGWVAVSSFLSCDISVDYAMGLRSKEFSQVAPKLVDPRSGELTRWSKCRFGPVLSLWRTGELPLLSLGGLLKPNLMSSSG